MGLSLYLDWRQQPLSDGRYAHVPKLCWASEQSVIYSKLTENEVLLSWISQKDK